METDIDWVISNYADMVYRIAFLYCHNSSDAQDMVQETFLRYLKANTNFLYEEHRKAWLIRVTINCCKNLHLSAWKKKAVLTSNDKLYRMKQVLHKSSEYDDVYKAIFKLKEKDRNLVYLFYYEEYSVEEIAQMLDLKESAIKTRLFRIRKKLKYILG